MTRSVQVPEVLAVVSEYRAASRVGEGKYILVGEAQARSTCFACRQDVVPQTPQCLDRRVGKVFIRVEAGHGLRLLVLANLPLDFVEVGGDIRPGVDQIGCPE